jgi:uncharacterized membrane protein
MDLVVAFVYAAGSVVCHQLPERSFFYGEWPFPVCARCTGLYLSAALGCAAFWSWRAARARARPLDPRSVLRFTAVAAVPTVLSYALGVAGIWDGSNLTRALLAAPLGLSVGAVVAAVVTKDLR